MSLVNSGAKELNETPSIAAKETPVTTLICKIEKHYQENEDLLSNRR